MAIPSQLRSHGLRKCINVKLTLIDQWDKSQLWYMYFPIGWWTSHKVHWPMEKLTLRHPEVRRQIVINYRESIVLRCTSLNLTLSEDIWRIPTKGLRLLPRGQRDRRCNDKSRSSALHSRGRGLRRWTRSPTGDSCRIGAQRIFIRNYSARKGPKIFLSNQHG